jgi:hypothetical protein
MRQVHKTDTKTNESGTWRGGVTVLVENTGASAGTVAGKSLASGESITFTAVDVGDHIQFDYDCTAPTTLEFTFGVREQRGAGFSAGTGKRV